MFASFRASNSRRLAATLYVYTFLDDFVLLYPVYALLFVDTGLSVAQISSLFIVWSVTAFVLEVPSGVWADLVSRRLLLCVAPLLGAVGFALWTAVPSYWAFLIGFVLWGAQGAMQSGALEALVYEELDRSGQADRYATIMGRAAALGVAGVMVANAIAGPVLSTGGFVALGVASVIARLACAASAVTFPEHRVATDGSLQPTEMGYLRVLRSGLREVRTSRAVRMGVVLVAAVTAVWGGLEEYDPLLASATGVADTTVPWLVLLISVGVTAGGLLAGPAAGVGGRGLGLILAVGALALALGAVNEHPAGFVLLAAAFCVFQLATVVADARLQSSISGSGRATVTSLAGVGVEVATVGVYASYAFGSTMGARHGTMFAAFAVPYLIVALALWFGGRGVTVHRKRQARVDATR